MKEKILIKEAIKARENAYCPYSNFKVGAAVLFEDGEIYTGCNIENASFGATICAERTAIFTAVSKGNTKLKAIALIGDLNGYTYPCGMCRQVMSEFAENGDIKVYIVKNETDYLVKTLDELMPGSFTRKDLE
ncbi:cytidine deaminase [Clostridium thermobutyricum]|uniref:Cytidine deaminase n=1 Tax=Clostridium thermobutyricum DSM 4928 TaxID=1121339 RepID=A0A1V4SPT0_9CLOT|nr:cytidine deaminase [Clostridium thermobutyricum]OPX45281.1 cytidine deaminase [Clostridium thermobutyricum DSM 4928]